MAKDSVALICDVAELSGLFEKSTSLEEFLQAVVETIAYHMQAAVCSVYLYDEQRRELLLTANQGLDPSAIGATRMKLGEGITGAALKELRPIREASGRGSSKFKPVPGIGEEKYEAFLAVPILRGLSRIGVLVVQDYQADYFAENDTRALQAIAAQLATAIESAKILMSLRAKVRQQEEPEAERTEPLEPHFVRTRIVSEGVAYGLASVLGRVDTQMRLEVLPETAGKTEADFNRALADAESQIQGLQHDVEEAHGDVSSLIFSAQLLMLRDDQFSGSMRRQIQEGSDPAAAIVSVVNTYIDLFGKSPNQMLRDKVYDVKDLGHRLLLNLNSQPHQQNELQGRIVVAHDLLPSDLLKLTTERAEGLIMVGGSITSHVAILARSLQLPAVIMEDGDEYQIYEGVPIQMDALRGTVYLHPSEDVIENYRRLAEDQKTAASAAEAVQPETYTADGERVMLMANVNLLSDLEAAQRMKVEGVGLYRSEFPFVVRNSFPSEEEQYRIYRILVETMAGRRVMLRTLDIGGDKMLSYFPGDRESNPFLGLRAIRFSLRHRDIFAQQLRAMLRAGVGAPIGILFPLISSVDDFLEAKEVVIRCLEELERAGVPHNTNPDLGVMVELPSAVEVIDELAREADFISIGSNDLVQYTLAVDRTNRQIADLYQFHHPAVLRSLKRIASAALRHETHLMICGDAARDIKMLPFLLGIGVRTFTVNAQYVPKVQKTLSALNATEAKAMADRILCMSRIGEIGEALQQPLAS